MLNRITKIPSDLLDQEDLILMELLVQRELSCLPEGLGTALVRALERLLTCVNVGVLLEVLPKGKLFEADDTDEGLSRGMS